MTNKINGEKGRHALRHTRTLTMIGTSAKIKRTKHAETQANKHILMHAIKQTNTHANKQINTPSHKNHRRKQANIHTTTQANEQTSTLPRKQAQPLLQVSSDSSHTPISNPDFPVYRNPLLAGA